MIAKDNRGEADFCHNSSLAFVEAINKATSSTNSGTNVVNSTFPAPSIEVSFIRAAVAAPLVDDVAESDQSGGSGATSITISSSFIYLSVLMGVSLLATLL
jgi:hypothetical protein